MMTFEKFYFEFGADEASHVSVGSVGDDCSLNFVASDDDPLHIEIKIRGVKEFERFIQHVHSLGMSLIESHRLHGGS